MLQDHAHASFDKLCYFHCLLQSLGQFIFIYVLLDFDSTPKAILNGKIIYLKPLMQVLEDLMTLARCLLCSFPLIFFHNLQTNTSKP